MTFLSWIIIYWGNYLLYVFYWLFLVSSYRCRQKYCHFYDHGMHETFPLLRSTFHGNLFQSTGIVDFIIYTIFQKQLAWEYENLIMVVEVYSCFKTAVSIWLHLPLIKNVPIYEPKRWGRHGPCGGQDYKPLKNPNTDSIIVQRY